MRHLCWILLATVGLVLTFTASPAYAWHCPKLAADAKALISKVEQKGGNAASIQKAKKLVDEGMAQHGAGKHDAALETLSKAIETAVHSVTHKSMGMSKKKKYDW
ncbi:hypothetical protein MYX64_05690 [Nitrospinae bacterium AH_259_B05_G02_I21]|nr:hypothetical protein [Nitrospinae bacterium AH_259_B05_G02_I21]